MKQLHLKSKLGRCPRMTALAAVALFLAPLSACSPSGEADEGANTDAPLYGTLPEDVQSAGKLTVATDASFGPPWMYAPEDDPDSFEGIDADILAGLSAKLGVEFDIESMGFDGVVPGLKAGRYDLAMAGMSDTAERQEQIDMIDYIVDGNSIVVAEGNPEKISSMDDLCGHPVAAVSGSFQLTLLEDHQSQCGDNAMEIKSFPSKQDTFLQIRSDRAMATLDGFAVSQYLATHDVEGAEGIEPVDTTERLAVKPLGIGVGKEDTELRDAVVGALEAMIDDGSYAEILEKWGISDLAFKKVSINDDDLSEHPEHASE